MQNKQMTQGELGKLRIERTWREETFLQKPL